MVARLDLDSVSLAQKPKSASISQYEVIEYICRELTDLDVTTSIKKNVVTLDIAMDNTLLMEMLKAAARLEIY